MKAVVLNGGVEGDDVLDTVDRVIADELASVGWEVHPFILRNMEIHHCVGCFGCWIQTPGVCIIDDAARDIAGEVIESDLAVFLTPVTFGGYSSELKKAVDRLICLVSPFFVKIAGEIHHRPRYEQYPRLMGVGVLPGIDQESERIFTTLVGRNAINLHSPAHVAGVVLGGQSLDKIRENIQALLAAVGVKQ